MPNLEITNALLRIESKAIRRVRTPEGARTYGQPIGTVITRDMIERAKRKREAEAKKKASDKKPTVNRAPSVKPIPADFKEPGLPGMGKFKSTAESNRKRHEKLLAKMSQGSDVVDLKGRRTFYKESDSAYHLDTLYWTSDDRDDNKRYTDAEVADILKGVPDFTYTHMDKDGELVKEHWAKTEDSMGGVATGNLGVGKKPEGDTNAPKAPAKVSSSETDKEIAHLRDQIAKMKAKPDTGVESTRKRRERQIAKAEERISELQSNKPSIEVHGSSLEKGDEILVDGDWKTVTRVGSAFKVQGTEAHFEDGTKQTIKRNTRVKKRVTDAEFEAYNKRVEDEESAKKKAEDDAKAEKDELASRVITADKLKVGDAIAMGTDKAIVVSIEPEGEKLRIKFDADSGMSPNGVLLPKTSMMTLAKESDASRNDRKASRDKELDKNATDFDDRKFAVPEGASPEKARDWKAKVDSLKKLREKWDGETDSEAKKKIARDIKAVTAELDAMRKGDDTQVTPGKEPEPEFREVQAKFIREGELVRHKGEWKKVEFADYGNGKAMLSLEGVAQDLVVPGDRAFDVQYPNGKKPVKGAIAKPKRKPGTSRFGNKPESGAPTSGSEAGTNDPNVALFKKHLEDHKDVPDGANASEAKSWAGGYRILEKAIDAYNLIGDSDARLKTLGVNAIGSGDRRMKSMRKMIESRIESDKRKGVRTITAGELKVGDVVKTYSSGSGKVDRITTLTNGDISYRVAGVGTLSERPLSTVEILDDENKAKFEAEQDAKPKAPKPKIAVPAPTKFADGNDVNIADRPLTGDEQSARAKKYEEDVVKQITEYRANEKGRIALHYKDEGMWTPSEEEFAQLKEFPADKIPEDANDFDWVDSPKTSNIQFARWGSMTLVRKTATVSSRNERRIFVKFGNGLAGSYSSLNQPRSGAPTIDAPEFFSFVAEKHKDIIDRPLPKRVQREETPFWDYWNGIRGIDWMEGEETDADYKTKSAYAKKNHEESKRLGVTVDNSFDPEHHAVLNSVLETYHERYPGFLERNINGFGIVDGRNSAVAMFHSNVDMTYSDVSGHKGILPIGHGANRLSFNNGYYGDNPKKRDELWKRLDRSNAITGFQVGGNRVDLAEKMGLKPEHVHAMYVTNHEIGHAVGSWIFGETGVNDSRGRSQAKQNPELGTEIANRYSDKVSEVLSRFGIMNKGDQLKNHVNTSLSGSMSDQTMNRLNRLKVINGTALSAHVSAYGATNLHEVMAETWASYSMDEKPTEFTLALGEIMEDLMLELSSDNDLAERFGEKSLSLREALEQKMLNIYMATR